MDDVGADPTPSSQPGQLRQQQQDPAPQAAPAAAAQADAAPTAAQQTATAQAGNATVQRMATQDTKAPIVVGEVGRLTTATKSTVAGHDGKFPLLPPGTIVVVDSIDGDKLTVYKSVTATETPVYGIVIASSAFHPEPDMMNNPKEGVWEGQAHYGKVKGDLWDPAVGPTPEQARHQGEAGDCYFISSMAAVCTQNPKQIEALFNPLPKAGEPPHKTYSVSLYKRSDTNALVRTTTSVDRWLPEADDNTQSVPTNDILYEGFQQGQAGQVAADGSTLKADPKSPHLFFWAELLEKAFAQIFGYSYNAIGSGGYPSEGLATLTGVESGAEYAGQNLGPPDGMDTGTWALQKFTAYQAAGTAVVCGTKGSWGSDSSLGPYGLYGSHAYQFAGVSGTNLIFKNPWGVDDPQPVPAANFLDVFDDVGSNAGNLPAVASKAQASPTATPTATAGSMAPVSVATRNKNN